MSRAKYKVKVEQLDGTVTPLGDVVAASPEDARIAARYRVSSRKKDLPPTGKVLLEAVADGMPRLADEARPTVGQLLRPSEMLD